MIKQKAPKDMTATEFVAHLEIIASREMLAKNLEGWAITLQGLRKELSEPAPNPFTPDQLAVMREHQRNGINFAVNNSGFSLLFYKKKPYIENNVWKPLDGFVTSIQPSISFLGAALEINEVICFADYAPLEEK